MKTKLLMTNLSTQYVKTWTTAEALREVHQNLLDAKKQFECYGVARWENNGKMGQGVYEDQGPGLEFRHLALGISEKAEGSIGQFGEGLKLALLVLAREGRRPILYSRNFAVEPKAVNSEDYQTEVLAFEVTWFDDSEGIEGTRVEVECTLDEFEEAGSYFEAVLEKNAAFKWIERELASQVKGLVAGYSFVNGSRMGTIETPYNYHIYGELSGMLNRDRNAIDMSRFRAEVMEKIKYTTSKDVIGIVLDRIQVRGSFEGFLPAWWCPTVSRASWLKEWTTKYGQYAVLATGIDRVDKQASYLGYRVIEVATMWVDFIKTLGVKTAGDVLQSDRTANKEVPLSRLSKSEQHHLELALKVATKLSGRDFDVQVVEEIFSTEERQSLGRAMYSPDLILLKRSILKDFRLTLDTVLHEATHLTVQSGDFTEAFQNGLLALSVTLLIDEGGLKLFS